MSAIPQLQLKQDYVVKIVSCGNCQQEQLVHVQARTGTWSTARQSVECLPCGQHFEVAECFPMPLSRSISTTSHLRATMIGSIGGLARH